MIQTLFNLHNMELIADESLETCTSYPFYGYTVDANEGTCFCTETAIIPDGRQDEKRMDNCHVNIRKRNKSEYIKIPETGIGDLSNGSHTFNELYYQRMILFAVFVKTFKGKPERPTTANELKPKGSGER